MIRTAVITPASTNDADLLERRPPTDAGSLYADKAYDTKANAAWLRQHGIKSQIAKKRRASHQTHRAGPSGEPAQEPRARRD